MEGFDLNDLTVLRLWNNLFLYIFLLFIMLKRCILLSFLVSMLGIYLSIIFCIENKSINYEQIILCIWRQESHFFMMEGEWEFIFIMKSTPE